LLDGGFRWHRFAEHFLYGDTNPAVIVDAKRGVVACYTDLDIELKARFHVVKLFVEKLYLAGHVGNDGDRFAAVSLY
jgi:hypothetical protein